MEERDFVEMNLPLTIKVCVSPGFNDKALQEVGYSDTWAYFLGNSMHNESLYGWAGHTETSEVFGNVSPILVIKDARTKSTVRAPINLKYY